MRTIIPTMQIFAGLKLENSLKCHISPFVVMKGRQQLHWTIALGLEGVDLQEALYYKLVKWN